MATDSTKDSNFEKNPRAMVIAELEYRKRNRNHYSTKKELSELFKKVIDSEKIEEIIEDLIRWDILSLVDGELSYVHILSKYEELLYNIWTDNREEILKNGF